MVDQDEAPSLCAAASGVPGSSDGRILVEKLLRRLVGRIQLENLLEQFDGLRTVPQHPTQTRLLEHQWRGSGKLWILALIFDERPNIGVIDEPVQVGQILPGSCAVHRVLRIVGIPLDDLRIALVQQLVIPLEFSQQRVFTRLLTDLLLQNLYGFTGSTNGIVDTFSLQEEGAGQDRTVLPRVCSLS